MIDVYERKHGRMYQQPFDEGFNTKEGDDVLSASPQEQDIEVRDALPAKLPPAPAGYRRVKIVKPDGGSYEAFFNDKYFPGTGKLFGPDMPDLASLAKVLPDGSLTHSATKPGEKIEELPSQLYRREQPENEGILRDSVLHTVRNEADIPSILAQGLRRGSNVTMDGTRPNQSLGNGVTLVYPKSAITAESKGYNPNDGIVTQANKVKPKAILVEIGDIIEEAPITFDEAITKLNRLQAEQENARKGQEAQRANLENQYAAVLQRIQVVEQGDSFILSLPAQTRKTVGVYDPRQGTNIARDISDGGVPAQTYTVEDIGGGLYLKHKNSFRSIKNRDEAKRVAQELFAEQYMDTKNPIDYQYLTRSWNKGRSNDVEIDRLFERIDKMTQEQTNEHKGFTAQDYIESLNLPQDIPIYTYIADEDGQVTELKRFANLRREQPEGEGLDRRDYYRRYDAQKKQELDAIRKQAMQQDTTLSRRNVGYAQATPEGERMPLGFISDTRKAILNKKIENAVANIVTRIGAKGSNITHIKGEDLADIKAAVMADISTKGLDTDRSNPLTSTIYRRTYAEINKLIAQKKLEPKTSLNQKTSSDKELSEIVAQAEDTGSDAVTAEEAIQIWESRLAKAPEQMKPLIEAELDRLSELHPEEFVDVEAVESQLIEQLKKQGTKREQPEDEGLTPRERQINSPEFKRWFGNSKVVDKDGKPLIVYHGTRSSSEPFTVFNTATNRTLGTHFGSTKAAEIIGSNIYPVYLKLENPFNWSRVGRKEHGFFSDNMQNIAMDIAEQTYYHQEILKGSNSVSFQPS